MRDGGSKLQDNAIKGTIKIKRTISLENGGHRAKYVLSLADTKIVLQVLMGAH